MKTMHGWFQYNRWSYERRKILQISISTTNRCSFVLFYSTYTDTCKTHQDIVSWHWIQCWVYFSVNCGDDMLLLSWIYLLISLLKSELEHLFEGKWTPFGVPKHIFNALGNIFSTNIKTWQNFTKMIAAEL